jgi:hypothetical protein
MCSNSGPWVGTHTLRAVLLQMSLFSSLLVQMQVVVLLTATQMIT